MPIMRGTFANSGGRNQKFKILGSNVYAMSPRSGSTSRPWFNIKGGKVYATKDHPEYGSKTSPVFRIEGNKVAPDRGHPKGWKSQAWFEIHD